VSAWSGRRPGAADVLTLGNALCGVTAVLVVSGLGPIDPSTPLERYRLAALLLLAGTLLDVLDGAVARRWGGTALGAPLDCLADAITFGVAPVVAVVALAGPVTSPAGRIALTAGALCFVVAALIRLADFAANRRDLSDFVGLPTTSACIGAVALGFLQLPPVLLALGLVGLGVLMVSPLTYPAGRRVVGVLVVGWAVGLVAIVGLVDVRGPAVLTLLIIAVVVPVGSRLRARIVASAAP